MTDEKSEVEAEGATDPAFEQSDKAGVIGESRIVTEQLNFVFRIGTRQYCTGVGDTISVPDVPNAWKDPEEDYRFKPEIHTDVLLAMVGEKTIVGTPSIPGAYVTLELADIRRGKRVINFKRRRRKNSSKRTKGHKWLVFDFIVKTLVLPKPENGVAAEAGA